VRALLSSHLGCLGARKSVSPPDPAVVCRTTHIGDRSLSPNKFLPVLRILTPPPCSPVSSKVQAVRSLVSSHLGGWGARKSVSPPDPAVVCRTTLLVIGLSPHKILPVLRILTPPSCSPVSSKVQAVRSLVSSHLGGWGARKSVSLPGSAVFSRTTHIGDRSLSPIQLRLILQAWYRACICFI
jgi:hypothetical protein